MRTRRKILVLLLAFIMIIPVVNVNASTVNDQAALQLYQLGLFTGVSTVSYVPNLEGETDREQAMIMLSKIFGWNLLSAENCTFLDVSQWAKAAVATAFDRGVTSGIGNGRFGGNNTITERQVISWITRELGYDDPYNNIYIAREIGLIDYASADRINKDIKNKTERTLNRDGLVGYFYDTLRVKPKGQNKTVIEVIVDKKPSIRNKAESFGLITPKEEPLQVKSIIVPNYYEVAVTFTGTMDPNKILEKSNYIINNNEVADIVLENNTAILVTKRRIERQGNMVVTVKKDIGIASDKVVYVKDIIDGTPPTVTKIETIKKDTIEITFSEPIFTAEKPKVKINNGAYYSIVEAPVGRKVRVQLSSSVPANSVNEITISGARDYENLLMEDYKGTFIYEVDTQPVAISVKGQVTPTRVVLELDKGIKGYLTADDLYWGLPQNKPDQVYRINETTYELIFIKYPIPPQYDTELVILSTNLETYWGIKTENRIELKIKAYADDVPPVIEKTGIRDNRDVVIYFSEGLEASSAMNGINYLIKDSNGNIVTDSRVQVYDHATKTVTIRFVNSIQGGKYSIFVQNVTDLSSLVNKIVPTTVDVVIPDTTPPIALKAEAVVAEKTIYVTFNEEVSPTGYNVKNWVLGGQYPSSIQKTSDPKTLKLTFADRIIDGQILEMGQISDLMGNKIPQLSTKVTWTKMGNSRLLSAKTVSANQLELVIDAVVVNGLEADNFRVLDNNGVAKPYIAVVEIKSVSEGKTTLLLTTTYDMQFTSSRVPRGISVLEDTLKTERGNYVTSDFLYTVGDGIAPQIETTSATLRITEGTQEFTRIKFNEGMIAVNQQYFATDIHVEINGKKLVPGNDFNIEMRADSASSDTAVIRLTTGFNNGKYVQAGDVIKISVQNPTYLKDSSGNPVTSFVLEKSVR